ncbi:MAG: RimK family alpha-L-glutamate ligase [Halobaculum sp.]
MSVQVGLLYSRIRTDEKLLLSELRDRGHEVEKIDVRKTAFGVGAAGGESATEQSGTLGDGEATDAKSILQDCDLVLDRCLATSRSLYATRFAESHGVPVVNSPETARVCADKVETSLALSEAGVPTPETAVAFDTDTALEVVESFGYPCVLKPVVGSWGRLMAKLDTRSAAEAVLEHKATLGHYEHKVFYVQQFVDKPGRDLRILTLDGEPVAGMARSGDHWLTNAKRGAETDTFEIDAEAEALARAAADAVGGGLLGVDLMETGDSYTVHEVNHTVEFTALNDTVETDVAAAVVDWLETKVADGDGQGDEQSTDSGIEVNVSP